jgi:hypothetical protein
MVVLRLKWLVAIAVFLSFTPAWALQISLTYDTSGSPQFQSMKYFHADEKAPAGKWKLPTLVGKHPLYATVSLGTPPVEYALVLDRQKAEDTHCNRLYFDANGNGDLTDDPPVDGQIKTEYSMTRTEFPAVAMTVTVDGNALPYQFTPTVRFYDPGMVVRVLGYVLGGGTSNASIQLRIDSVYTGKFEFGGQEYQVALIDDNGNGCFGDPMVYSRGFNRGRRSYVEADKLMLASGEGPAGRDVLSFGTLLVLKDTLFEVKINIPEKMLTLTPYAQAAGRVKMASVFQSMTFYDEITKQGLMVFRPEASIPFPAGSFRLCAYQMSRQDDQGDQWSLTAEGTTDIPAISVKSGEEVAATLGEPFAPTITVEGNTIHSGFFTKAYATLAFEVYGSGRELMQQVTRVSGDKTKIPLSDVNRNQPREPGFKITKADGEVVAQGQFRYG